MPLYDCVLLLKPLVKKDAVVDLLSRVGKHVLKRNGVVTKVKSFGTVQLGYGIKKIDGRYYEGQLMQMSMMATPNINKELHYLNKEDRLLRWILVKQDMKYEDEASYEDSIFRDLYGQRRKDSEDDDDSFDFGGDANDQNQPQF